MNKLMNEDRIRENPVTWGVIKSSPQHVLAPWRVNKQEEIGDICEKMLLSKVPGGTAVN